VHFRHSNDGTKSIQLVCHWKPKWRTCRCWISLHSGSL